MGRWIRSKAVYMGRNYDVGAWRDDKWYRCSRCGFINNLDREMHVPDGGYEGWGTSFVQYYNQTTITVKIVNGVAYQTVTTVLMPQNLPVNNSLQTQTQRPSGGQ